MNAIDRFMRKVLVRKNDCWLWTAAKRGSRQKRGCFWDGKKNVDAARWLLTRTIRPPKDGECACHTCDNPLCVNPDHLFWATQAENVADMHRKGRSHHQTDPSVQQRAIAASIIAMRENPDFCRRGERHGMAKLSSKEAECIRDSSLSNAALATRFGISRTTVSRIKSGKLWVCLARKTDG
jgi:DNA-binding transcriptional regulator YiaG